MALMFGAVDHTPAVKVLAAVQGPLSMTSPCVSAAMEAAAMNGIFASQNSQSPRTWPSYNLHISLKHGFGC